MNSMLLSTSDTNFKEKFLGLPFSAYPESLKAIRSAQNDGIDSERLLAVLIVEEHSTVLARVTIYRSDADDTQHTFLLGNYEAENDLAGAHILAAAEEYARAHGAQKLLGPMNGSTWATYRFRTDATQEVFFSEHWHPHAYLIQWQNAGFTSCEHYISTIDRTLNIDAPEVLKKEQELATAGLTIHPLRASDFTQTNLIRLYHFCTTAFRDNVFYAHISEEEFILRYANIGKYIAPGSSCTIEDQEGNIHGLLLAYPDHFCTTEKRFIIKTVARHPKATFKGLGTLLGNIGTRYAKQNGYTSVIHAYMHTGNKSVQLSSKFSGEPLRTYVLLEKQLA